MDSPQMPQPVVTETKCALCGLMWEAHGEGPTPETCIRLLRVELTKRSYTTTTDNRPFFPTKYPPNYGHAIDAR